MFHSNKTKIHVLKHTHTHFLIHLYLCVQMLYQYDTIPVLCAGRVFDALDVPSCMKNLFLTSMVARRVENL